MDVTAGLVTRREWARSRLVRDPRDAELVDGLRRGDRAAFDATYDRHRARIHAFLLRLCGRRDVAEDLFQETWFKAARAAPRLEEDTDLAAWLFTIARNTFVSYRRWSMLDVSRFVALLEESPVPADGLLPDESLDASRALSRLERALAALSPKDREVLLLVGVEGFEQEAAASILGIRYDAFRQRLARARGRLAEALARIVAAPREVPT
jgi:RNA polymerase sigma factor (sigma-70 family)